MAPHGDRVETLVDELRASRIDRRQFVRRATALGLSGSAVSALLAACGGGGQEAAPPPPAATGAAASTGAAAAPPPEAAPQGGTLRIRLLNDVINLDPPFFPAAADENSMYSVYEGLITYKPGTWEIVNQLAETFEPSADNLQYHFKLKEGIQFHGGYGELTADDIKFSFERTAGLSKPAIDSPYKGDWVALKEVKVESTYEGTIVLKEVFAPIMATTLPVFSGWVVSKKAVEDRGKKYATNPIGTGPYEFVEWKPKQHVKLRKFADYGGASSDFIPAQWDEIVLVPIDEDNAADIALEAGEIDFAQISLPSIDRWQANGDYTVEKRTTLDYQWVGMNIENPKLKDVNVRQAIRYAIDVPSIIEAAFEGRWERASAILPPGMPIGYWKDAPIYDRDVDKAKSFLAKAANPPTELEFRHAPETGAKETAEIVQANLADIGIKVTIKQLDSSAYYALEKKELRSRELMYVGYISSPDPWWSMEWFTCEQIDVWNWMYWCNDEFDALNKEALKTTDQAKRNDLYIQAQKLWDEAVHTVWLAWPTYYFAGKKSLQPGLRLDGRILPSAFTTA